MNTDIKFLPIVPTKADLEFAEYQEKVIGAIRSEFALTAKEIGIEEAEKPYIEVEIDPKLAQGVARAMQQVAGVAKLYIKYGGPFVPLPANKKVSVPPVKRKPGARTIKRTLKFMR